jgi:hypothetical protein
MMMQINELPFHGKDEINPALFHLCASMPEFLAIFSIFAVPYNHRL